MKVVTEWGTFSRSTKRDYLYLVITTGQSEQHIRANYEHQKAADLKAAVGYTSVVEAMQDAGANFALRITGSCLREQELIGKGLAKKGQLIFASVKPEGYEGSGYNSVEEWQSYANGCMLSATTSDSRADEAVAKEQARGYHDIQWSTRYQLAVKYANELRSRNFENVRVIEVATGLQV